MQELKDIIGANITELRRVKKLTQQQFAEKLNYTDKAVSKWERGESIPDVTVLKQIADMFGVSVDYLLSEKHSVSENRSTQKNRLTIEAMSCVLVFALATVLYFIFNTVFTDFTFLPIYSSAACACCALMIVFISIWGRHKKLIFVFISILVWAALLTVFLFWQKPMIFLIGIPLQVFVLLFSFIRFTPNKKTTEQ